MDIQIRHHNDNPKSVNRRRNPHPADVAADGNGAQSGAELQPAPPGFLKTATDVQIGMLADWYAAGLELLEGSGK